MIGHQANNSGIREQAGYFADATTVLRRCIGRKAEIGVQTVAKVVGVEDVGDRSRSGQFGEDEIGDGRFAGAGKARQPHGRPLRPHIGPALRAGRSSAATLRRATGECIFEPGHADTTVNTALSPNGSRSISASHDQSDMR